MQNGKQVTSGIVLRSTDTKETDKILTVLTPDRGKIAVIARGARRKNSRLAASCQLLAYSELTIYQRGNWCYLDEAGTIELFDGVRQDFELLSLASYFAELTESPMMRRRRCFRCCSTHCMPSARCKKTRSSSSRPLSCA